MSFEKCRPMLRGLFPRKDEREITAIASAIYRAGQNGAVIGEFVICRRENPGIYKDAADFVRGKRKANPFDEDAKWFQSLTNRKCLH